MAKALPVIAATAALIGCVGTPHDSGVVIPSEYPAFRAEVDTHPVAVLGHTVSYEHYRTAAYEESPGYQLAIWYAGFDAPARPGVHSEIEAAELAAIAVPAEELTAATIRPALNPANPEKTDVAAIDSDAHKAWQKICNGEPLTAVDEAVVAKHPIPASMMSTCIPEK